MVDGLTTGEKVWWKSTPGRWENPRTTHRALRRSSVPSGCSLFLKIHLPVMMLALGGRGMSVQVPFAWRALNSSFMAAIHSGSRKAAWTEVGGVVGEEVVATCAYFGFGTWIPSCPRVTMWCLVGAAGGGIESGFTVADRGDARLGPSAVEPGGPLEDGFSGG